MNILKEKELYNFLKNLNMKAELKEALKYLVDYLRLDADAAWVLLVNPKTNEPLVKISSYAKNFADKAHVAKVNKLVLDYFANAIEQEDILEFISSISDEKLVLEPIVFAGNLQGVLGVIGQERAFVQLLLECARQKFENFSLIEENERTFKERMEFLASISHEFKTPLNSIIGFSDIIKARNENPKIGKYIQNISNSSRILLGLILDVLDLSRSQTKQMELKYETFSSKEVILEILSTLETQAREKNLEVSYTLTETLLCADLRRFRQLVLNLVSNAVKFNKINGKIAILTYQNDKEFVFEVKDTGEGISKKDYGKIFKFFSQVSHDRLKRQQGSGIGLSLCKTIVDAHRGTINFKSRLNFGTTFWFTLPNQ